MGQRFRAEVLQDLFLLSIAVAVLVVPGQRWLRTSRDLPVEEWPLARLRLDINAAPWYEWALLEGIGERRARRVVNFRTTHGPFKSLEELSAVPGMPTGWVKRVEAQLLLC